MFYVLSSFAAFFSLPRLIVTFLLSGCCAGVWCISRMWRFRPFWFLRALPQMSHFTDSTFVGISGICVGAASLILSASRTLRYCWRKLSWYFCLLHFWIAIGNLFLVLVVSRVGNDLVIGWFGSDNILFSVALQCFSSKLAIGMILYFLISS